MSASPQLEIKFLDIFGDTYNLPGGSILMTADRKLGVPGYDDFLDKYGFKGSVAKTTPGASLVGGVATEEEAEFVKYFGVPYIYGPALATQKVVCRPAEYAKIAPFLKHRLTTLDAQINNAISVSTGGMNLPKQRFQNIKNKLANYISEMDSTKTLPKCDDYKIDYFQDDSDMLNYLTRALYYGLKPDKGTDEHVKCVNLFRDAKGGDVELQALLQVVKDKRTDGMLSFMEMVGSSLAGLVHKINEDRSFASPAGTVSGAAPGAAGPAAPIPGIDPKIIQDLKNQLADYFNNLDSAAKIGEPLRTANDADLVKTFTEVVSKAGPLLTSKSVAGPGSVSGSGPGPGGFPSSLDELSAGIISKLDSLGVKGVAKPNKFYNSDYQKVLQDILQLLEKGPVTAAAIGAVADKLALVKAFEGFDIYKLLDFYIKDYGILSSIIASTPIGGVSSIMNIEESAKETLKLYQILFAICNKLNKFTGINKANYDKNIKIPLNNYVTFDGSKHRIKGVLYYKSQYIDYGLYKLSPNNDPSKTLYVRFDSDKLESTTEETNSLTIAFTEYNTVADLIENKYKGVTIGSSLDKMVFREHYHYNTPGDGSANKTYHYVVKNDKKEYEIVELGFFSSGLSKIVLGAADNGTEVVDITGGGSGPGAPSLREEDAIEIARLQKELIDRETRIASLTANMKIVQDELDTFKGKAVGDPEALKAIQNERDAALARVASLQTDLATAIAKQVALQKALDAEKEKGDDASAARIAELEAELAAAKTASTAAAEAAAAEIKRLTDELAASRRERKTELEENGDSITEDEEAELEKLKASNAEIITLQTQIATLETAITALTTTNEELGEQLAALQMELVRARTELGEAMDALEVLRTEKDAEIQAEKDRCAEVRAALDRLFLASGTADPVAAAAAFSKAGNDLTAANANLDKLRVNLVEAHATIVDRDDQIRNAEERIDELEAASASRREGDPSITDLKLQLTTARQALTEAEAARVAADTSLAKATTSLTEAQARVTDLEAAAVTAASNLAAAQSEGKAGADESLAAITKLTEQLTKEQRQVGELEGRLAAEASKVLANSERAALTAQIQAAEQKVREIAGSLGIEAARAGDSTVITKAIKVLRSSEAEASSRATGLTNQLAPLRSKLSKAETELTKARNEAATKEGTLASLQTQLATAQAAAGKVPGMEEEVKRLQAEITKLQEQLAALNVSAKRAEVASLTAQEAELGSRVASLQETRQANEQRILKLQGEEKELLARTGQVRGVIGFQQLKDSLEKQIASLTKRAEAAELKAGILPISADMAEWEKGRRGEAEAEVKKKDAEIAGLRSAVAGQEQIIGDFADQLRKLQAQLRDASEPAKPSTGTDPSYTNLQFNIEKLLKEKAALEAKLAEAMPAAATDDPSISAMLQIIRDYINSKKPSFTEEERTKIEADLASLEPLRDRIERLETMIVDDLLALDEAKEQLAASQELTADAEERARVQIEELQTQLEIAVDEYSTQIRALEETIRSIKATHVPKEIKSELNAKIRALESQISEYKREKREYPEEPSMGYNASLVKSRGAEARARNIAYKAQKRGGMSRQVGNMIDLQKHLDAVEEARRDAMAATESELERVKDENEELQTENETLKGEIATLRDEIAKARSATKVQTFGSLSGMLSSPAFRSATLGIFTKFAGDRDEYNSAANANVRNTVPDKTAAPGGFDALKKYYLDNLVALGTSLNAFDSETLVIDPADIQVLANILKTMSSPQPAGLYSLKDQEYNEGEGAMSLVNIIEKINPPNYNSTEPCLYIPTVEDKSDLKNAGANLSIGDKKFINLEMKRTLLENFFKANDNLLYLMYPQMKISSEGTDTKERAAYIENIDLNFFEIKENTVRFGRYLTKATPVSNTGGAGLTNPTLGDIKKGNEVFFASHGKLISREEIVKLFIRSLLSSLEGTWGIKTSRGTVTNSYAKLQKKMNNLSSL
jgi:chromosome segregation ATPase